MALIFSKNPILFNRNLEIRRVIKSPSPFSLYSPPFSSLHFLIHSTPPVSHYQFLTPRRFSTNMSDSNSDSGHLKTVRVEIKGVVQGVFFRNWTIENATKLGLNGWVRNRRDGSVEALFSGSSDKVDEMQQRCRRGPNSAIVTSFQSFPGTDDPGSGFQRRPTV